MILVRLQTFLAEKGAKDPVLSAFIALAKDSVVYLAGAVMIGLGNFILIPLYTRYLAPTEFGVYALVDVAILVVVTVTQLGLGVSYLKWFADLEEARRGTILGSMLISGMFAALLGGVLYSLAVASSLGERWLQTTDRGFAWTLLPIIVLENAQGLLLTDLRARRKTVAFSASAVIRLLTMVGASLWFIVVQRQGVTGVFVGRLVGDSLTVLALIIFSLRSTRLGFAWSVISPMIRYGLPLIWSALMGMMLDASGRYFLSHFSTMEQVGFYSAAIKIANVFQLLISQPFGVAWGGLMFQIVKWPNARLVYSKILVYVFVLSSAAALILVLFTPTLFAVFATDAYAPAMAVFPIVLLVRTVNIMEYPTAIGIYLEGRTKWFALIYSIGLGVNLFVNRMLTPAYGMFGAAWSWLVAWVVITGLIVWIGQQCYPLYYDWKLFLVPVVSWGLILLGHNALFTLAKAYWPVQIASALGVVLGTVMLLVYDFRLTRRQILLERVSQ